MSSLESMTTAPEERKSAKYKEFPEAGLGVWGAEVREKHYDKLHEAILARIRHVSGRIDTYLPPYEKNYNVDQSLALDLESSFDELAQLYLECAKENLGGYFYPTQEDGHYSYEPIKAFEEKLEEIHTLVIDAEKPFFDEKEGRVLIDEDGNQVQGAGAGYRELSVEEKTSLHEQGVGMLTEAVEKINELKATLATRSPLVA